MFGNIFHGKRIFVTGHTGFKGAWLVAWLRRLGAEVIGFALPPETEPNLYSALQLEQAIEHIEGDITDFSALQRALQRSQPELVVHLAAQALVRKSYVEPHRTFAVNAMGTLHLLEALRSATNVRACLVVTSDKCYENREWNQAYSETDALGGHDPYSASKGCAEIIAASYRRSFFHDPAGMQLATARAGNVIGGGDWSPERLVPDFIASMNAGESLRLRYPQATRPWQHVLEPLSGYLTLLARLMQPQGWQYAQAWNFGPHDCSAVSVGQLAQQLCRAWGQGEVVYPLAQQQLHEAHALQLDSTKAREELGWSSCWNVEQTIEHTIAWYREFYHGVSAAALVNHDIELYQAESYEQLKYQRSTQRMAV